jgi:hypothetical protein
MNYQRSDLNYYQPEKKKKKWSRRPWEAVASWALVDSAPAAELTIVSPTFLELNGISACEAYHRLIICLVGGCFCC